jgi:hypothetical protein
MHSVLTGRMLLKLRQYEHKIVGGGGRTELTGVSISLEFMHPVTSVSSGGLYSISSILGLCTSHHIYRAVVSA